jgi:hypothetical protein
MPPNRNYYVDKSGRGIKEIVDHIPLITLFRRAKTAERAKRSASKKGSVISCVKVDSHIRRLDMISHLRLDQKPLIIDDFIVADFTIGRDLEITPSVKGKKIDVE